MDQQPDRQPIMVGWGITDRCNLSCSHCYSAVSHGRRDELTTDQALAVIDGLGTLGTQQLGWTGGEPLLRKDLEVLIAYATDQYGIRCGITTNGIPLIPKRAEKLKKAGLSFVQVSLDGTTAARNRRIRGASDRAFRMILKALRSSHEVSFDVHMAMFLAAETLDDARGMVDLARKMGVRSLRFCGYVPSGDGASEFVRKRLDLSNRLGEVRRLVEDLQYNEDPIVMFDPGLGPLPPDYFFHDCVAGKRLLYISGNGNVYPCTSLLDDRFLVGNLRERSIVDLWHDPEMTRMAEYPRHEITGPCASCDLFERCHGACRGLALAATGDLNASFPTCLYRAEVRCAGR